MARRRGRRKQGGRSPVYEVDLHGLTWAEAERRLKSAPREAAHLRCRVLKIIHGWGSASGSNVLQRKTRGWLARSPFRFRAAIPGEAYHIGDPTTTAMRDEVGPFDDSDYGAHNEGVTLVWLK